MSTHGGVVEGEMVEWSGEVEWWRGGGGLWWWSVGENWSGKEVYKGEIQVLVFFSSASNFYVVGVMRSVVET